MVLSIVACGGAGTGAQPGTPEPAAEPASTAAAVESKGADSAAADSTGSGAAENATAESSAAGNSALAGEETEIQVFIAASLNTVMQEVAAAFNEQYPNIKITYNADSSGTLLTQIEEGYACDVFFSAAQKQMNKLEQEDGLVVEGTRANVVNNQVVVVTRKDSGTAVTGLSDIAKASSIALADGSVPVGRYTRVAMINSGLLPGYEVDAASDITTQQVSDALGGVEISEQGNVSKVLAAVVEASCEVGTTYYSDTYGYEDQLDILETVGYDLTGDVIYPIAQVVNEEADEAEKAAAAEFVKFVTGDEAKDIFEAYYFDTDVE
ncbi:MAG: molybdate ABC transporter substrate-binding protein [Lachnospiraceae bacterium]|nr:molybdate ABC transporter substrate-binding protein [Lachnospiraceae bacterium]